MSVTPICVDLPKSICAYKEPATKREWLVTNGMGGFASGTISGILTRRYHGLLIAALKPPLGRTLMVSRLDEELTYQHQTVALHSNAWTGDVIHPKGFIHLNRFHLEGMIPVWTYAFADVILEKRVWMQAGANTTYVRYSLIQGTAPVQLTIKTLG